jgi:hypothetical protein
VSSSPEEQKLAELRARREALEADRDKRQQARAISDQIDEETRKVRDLEAIQKAETEHGPVGKAIRTIETPNGVVIVKKPNMVLFRRFQDVASAKSEDLDKLVRPTLVHPTKAEFDQWLEEYPGILTPVADAVCLLAGVASGDRSGKS